MRRGRGVLPYSLAPRGPFLQSFCPERVASLGILTASAADSLCSAPTQTQLWAEAATERDAETSRQNGGLTPCGSLFKLLFLAVVHLPPSSCPSPCPQPVAFVFFLEFLVTINCEDSS